MSSVPRTTAANLNVGWDPTPLSTPISGDLDSNSLIERTKEVKVDVNDYSRFKDIGKDLEDEDMEKPETVSSENTSESKCRNCNKVGSKLKCSICKKAVYCERKCQASDWQFHKRICKKPEPPKKPDPPRKSRTTSPTKSPPSKSSSSSLSSGQSTTSSGSSIVVTDEPDLPEKIRGYKNGLPYFHRELSKEEKTLIGDIAPQKIETNPAEAKPVQHDGSAWNKAGTFEERVVTKWAKDKWKEILTGATYAESNLKATLKAPDNISGDASICVVRGKKRYLFDFSFKLSFEIAISSGTTCEGIYDMKDISNDEDYEISCKLTKNPKSISEQNAVRAFIASNNNGLQKEVVRLIHVFATEFQQL
ncbi:hsp90-like protein [Plasmopara halstedii]|uniref:Hsp90-like protein n=1 Tax=Plasmopara halstedii TaxID=4781 RepID=A0A0P1ATQ5_PLAHL|nr:hsp90-like protein [Plasmopara halstedii]CEG44686.1 hsp90-like protein [Plasmopara halstedii]|eukprot:XP_024581055.1 hsp90-like protein [Plasmopara halstedii]